MAALLRRLKLRFLNSLQALVMRRRRSALEGPARRVLPRLPFREPARSLLAGYVALSRYRRVKIVAPDEVEPNLALRLTWGDYWARYELTKALGQLGYLVTDQTPDVVIHLFGRPEALPARTHNIAWIYSHPDRVTPDDLRQYRRIFCLSSSFADKVRRMGFAAEAMPAATSRTLVRCAIEHDVVFVGNTRRGQARRIVFDLGQPEYDLKVWGRGWEALLPPQCIGGVYHDYPDLARLYASALVSLCDHQPDMRREGFVNIRVFDILASGGFCISDANPGIDEIFGDCVPQYRSPSELQEMVRHFLRHPDDRLPLMERGRDIAARHTWRDRAEQLTRGIAPKVHTGEGIGDDWEAA
jgi:hypothetical protein